MIVILIPLVLMLAVGIGVWQGLRGRKETLSGLNSERPVFHISPPAGRLDSKRRETL